MRVLGIDTSNYTTSVALATENSYRMERRILTVAQGECGLRQSNALFLHTVNLPELMRTLAPASDGAIDAVAVSTRPRDVEGSYMPCFLAGVSAAESVAASLGVPLYSFSHQAGHVMAAVRTCGSPEVGSHEFLAFHLSGGTTELLLARPDPDLGFAVEIIGQTCDLSAGQIIDRIGVMLGLTFPCGGELEKLAAKATSSVRVHPCLRGADCHLSGAENQAQKMIADGASPETVARFALDMVFATIAGMTKAAREEYPTLPIVYAGGVMRNAYLKTKLKGTFRGVYFADTELSSDNAVGTAYLGLEKRRREG